MSHLFVLLLLAQGGSLAGRSQEAKQALLTGHAPEAVKLYRELVRELPGDTGMRLNLALALESAGEYSQEVVELRSILKKRPDTAAAWLLMGLAQQKLGRPAEAVAPLRRVLVMEPENRTALFELGDAYLVTGKFAEAVEQFRVLVGIEPASAKALQGLGLSYAGLARATFSKLEVSAPHSGFWSLLSARSQLDQENYRRAFGLFREALEKQPDLPGIHEGLAEVYEKTGHSDWAATERDQERAIQNRNCQGGTTPANLFCLATTYQAQAQAAFEHLAGLPESAEVHELLAEANQQQGRRGEAIGEWQRALALSPRDSRIAGKLAESLWLNRSYEEAFKLLDPLVAANPGTAQWQYLIGDVLFLQKQPELALPHLEAAVRLNPAMLPAHAVLGRTYLQLGEPRKAIPHLEKARAVDEETISFQLGQAYRATGQVQLAEESFARHREFVQRKTSESRTEPEITGPHR